MDLLASSTLSAFPKHLSANTIKIKTASSLRCKDKITDNIVAIHFACYWNKLLKFILLERMNLHWWWSSTTHWLLVHGGRLISHGIGENNLQSTLFHTDIRTETVTARPYSLVAWTEAPELGPWSRLSKFPRFEGLCSYPVNTGSLHPV